MEIRAKWFGALATVLAVVSIGAASAFAEGAGTETMTEHAHEVPLIEKTVTNKCTGEEGTLLGVARNFKIHATTQADGNTWVTGTGNGSLTFTPVNPGGVTYSGHFTQWFGESLNNKNKVEHATGTFVLRGTDGSTVHIHMVFHLSTNANGEVTMKEAGSTDFDCG
jgi:hypothetical protein